MNGFGSFYYPSGKLGYQGFWVDEKYHGKGILFNDNPDTRDIDFENISNNENNWISYQGEFVNGLKDGKGVLTFVNGER